MRARKSCSAMASTRKSPRVDAAQAQAAVDAALAAALTEHVAPGARLAVALSGGIDSMVLLDAVARAAPHGLLFSAIHVHHGLSPNAEHWAEFCSAQCARRGVPLVTHRLRLERRRGESLEALARTARYARLLDSDVDAVA